MLEDGVLTVPPPDVPEGLFVFTFVATEVAADLIALLKLGIAIYVPPFMAGAKRPQFVTCFSLDKPGRIGIIKTEEHCNKRFSSV